MAVHRALKYVALLAVEPRYGLRMRLEPIVAPRIEDGKRDRLSERGGM